MPEDAEIDTDRLREEIPESPANDFLRNVALSTALLAALAAIAALRAGATVNEALLLKTEAARLQTEASDQWTYYQAKGIKASVQEASRAAWRAAGKEPPAALEQSMRRYMREQQEIEKKARGKELERDERSHEADGLLAQHHQFANSVAIIQVSIALGAVAALTRKRWIWFGALLLGIAGAGVLVGTLLR
jgi:hypothetical protein